jgi:hypothetical protein
LLSELTKGTAMAISTGTVANLKYGDDFGFVTLTKAGGLDEIFILWFGDNLSGGPIALYSMLLAIALSRNLTVDIVHEDDSAFIQMVRLFPP